MAGSRVVIQGFGKVGGPLAFLLPSAGMRVVAVGDVGGAVPTRVGSIRARSSEHVAATGSVVGFTGGEPIARGRHVGARVRALRARGARRRIDEEVAGRLGGRVMVEAANGPTVAAKPTPCSSDRGIDGRARHPGQRRRRDRVVLRVGPEPAGIHVGRGDGRRAGCASGMEDAFITVWAKADNLSVSLRRAAFVVALERVAEAIAATAPVPLAFGLRGEQVFDTLSG